MIVKTLVDTPSATTVDGVPTKTLTCALLACATKVTVALCAGVVPTTAVVASDPTTLLLTVTLAIPELFVVAVALLKLLPASALVKFTT